MANKKRKGSASNRQLQAICGLMGIALVTGIPLAHWIGYRDGARSVPPAASPRQSTSPAATADPHGSWTLDNLLIRFNEQRVSRGLLQLSLSLPLDTIAQTDLVGNCPVTGHDGFRKQEAAGKLDGFGKIAEVLESGSSTPEDALMDLMGSIDHKDIILGSTYRQVGVGLATVNGTNCVSFVLSEQ